jgi:hypothetical protein
VSAIKLNTIGLVSMPSGVIPTPTIEVLFTLVVAKAAAGAAAIL